MEEDKSKALRDHLIELLEGRSAHIEIKSALDGFPLHRINDRVAGSPHTAWQLLEHIRLAQSDIIDFSINSGYKEMTWPDDYWPAADGSEDDWERCVAEVLSGLDAMRDLVRDPNWDLFKPFGHGTGQTLLREAMLVADHNSYHLGQLMLLRRIFENE